LKGHNSLLKKVASTAEARRKCPLRVKNEAKKRSLHGVNEHFELNFDDASASAVVFQRADKFRLSRQAAQLSFTSVID
jgi:hypothetical protein